MGRLVLILLLFMSMNAQADWTVYALEYLEKHPIVYVDPQEKTCLAHNIYFEARNESYDGMLAVATVTQNRVLSMKYPNTYCGVVWQLKTSPRTGKKVPQFSWTLDGKSDIPHELEVYAKAEEIAEEVLRFGKRSDIIDYDVLNYHADYVQPFWAEHMELVVQIDTHLFYSH